MIGSRNRKDTDTCNRVCRKKLTACMTCPLCSELFIDATTVSECLHTFCRRCIHKRIIEEGLNRCPVCGTQLGCSPTEKLRPDHNIQYLITKIFSVENPVHENEAGDESEESLGQISCRRKEKLISSLVEGSNKATAKNIHKRVKYASRRRQEAEGSHQHVALNNYDTPEASGSGDRSKSTESEATQRRSKVAEKTRPVWFSLMASDHQEGVDPLPQLSPRYLRVKDGRLPVSVIKKYLVQKLGLESESEVEIWLQGETVETSLELHAVIERWLRRTSPSSRTHKATVGASAKDFVMVLFYARKR